MSCNISMPNALQLEIHGLQLCVSATIAEVKGHFLLTSIRRENNKYYHYVFCGKCWVKTHKICATTINGHWMRGCNTYRDFMYYGTKFEADPPDPPITVLTGKNTMVRARYVVDVAHIYQYFMRLIADTKLIIEEQKLITTEYTSYPKIEDLLNRYLNTIYYPDLVNIYPPEAIKEAHGIFRSLLP